MKGKNFERKKSNLWLVIVDMSINTMHPSNGLAYQHSIISVSDKQNMFISSGLDPPFSNGIHVWFNCALNDCTCNTILSTLVLFSREQSVTVRVKMYWSKSLVPKSNTLEFFLFKRAWPYNTRSVPFLYIFFVKHHWTCFRNEHIFLDPASIRISSNAWSDYHQRYRTC